jgi:GDP-L-fucose synthase
MKKVLVLGSSGFVGRHVFEELSKNENLIVLKHAGKKTCDLSNYQETRKYFESIQPDIIVNCAAVVGSLNYVYKNAADIINQNSNIILSIYEAAKIFNEKISIIQPIANCAYPGTNITFEEDKWLDGPLHPSVMSYGFTRRMIWHAGECYRIQHGVKSYYFFVPNMYGPYDSTNPDKAHALNALISKFVKAKLSNEKKVVVWGTGIAVREWLYARDFARVINEFIHEKVPLPISEPTNIAQNFGLSVKDIVYIINKYFDNEIEIIWDKNMPDGTPRKVMSDLRFRKYFPDFKFTPMDQGIKETIKYYESIYPY